MSLTISHGVYSGSCTAFNRLRNEIARALEIIGKKERLYPLLDEGPGMDFSYYDYITDYKGNWDRPPEDAIFYLLAHSDCDGVIHAEDLPELIVRLRQALEQLKDPIPNLLYSTTNEINRLIDGASRALDAGEDLVFS